MNYLTNDIRYKVLLRLQKQKNGTDEFKANEFLTTLHDDLGTVRRALIDLVESGYIRESNVDASGVNPQESVIYNIKSRGPKENKKAIRLVEDKSIGVIRIHITLKGIQFMTETENEHIRMRSIKNEWWKNLIFLILGSVLTLIVGWLG